MAAEGGLVWVYGVAGDDIEAFADGMAGVGGAPPRTITAAGLTAIVGDVGDREYGTAALRRNLEDLDWLALTARAHHAVLEAVAGRGPVVPMRMATLFAADAANRSGNRALEEENRQLRSRVKALEARSHDGG